MVAQWQMVGIHIFWKLLCNGPLLVPGFCSLFKQSLVLALSDLWTNILPYRKSWFKSPTLSYPPWTHTSDRPIFKIPFDSENSGKLTRFRIARFLIFASYDPLNCSHIFWVKLALYHKCTFFTHGYSRDIPKRKALSY